MACNPLHMFVFRLIYSASGILFGIIAAAVFSRVFHNSHSACWALASAVLSVICMAEYIYLYVIKERKRRAPSAVVLTIFGIIGALCLGLGAGGFVAYLGLAITDSLNHVEISLPASYYVVCVWNFMVFKWGLTIYLYSIISYKYLKKVPKGFKPIETDENEIAADEEVGNDALA